MGNCNSVHNHYCPIPPKRALLAVRDTTTAIFAASSTNPTDSKVTNGVLAVKKVYNSAPLSNVDLLTLAQAFTILTLVFYVARFIVDFKLKMLELELRRNLERQAELAEKGLLYSETPMSEKEED